MVVGRAIRVKAVPLPGLDDPPIVALTERFGELRRQFLRDAVDTVVEMGEILLEGARRLRGQYLRWLDRLGIVQATASNYMRVARLARGQPHVIQAWKELGLAKLYRLSALSPEGRQSILRRGRRPELMAMNDEKFAALTAPYLRRLRTVTPAMRAHGLRMKVQAWSQTLADARVSGVGDAKLRDGLRADLGRLVQRARAAARSL